MSESAQEHRAAAPGRVLCAVVTVSDTRSEETDRSGGLIKGQLAAAGHEVISYQIVRDEAEQIVDVLSRLVAHPDCQAILFNGGTGIARRDTTFDAVDGRLQKRLPGFGELFRGLSYAEIGPAALLSRATAGVIGDTVIFVMPGSSNAVRLAMEKLIVPELAHIVYELHK